MRSPSLYNSLNQLKSIGIPVDMILDVGVQHRTLPLIKVHPDIRHMLFEPISEYYPHISNNYEAIDHLIVQAAVSDVDGQVFMHSEKNNRGDEISHSWIVDNPSGDTRTVNTITLDYYLESIYCKNFLLKIDVEGWDVPQKILSGAKNILNRTSVVVIEMTVDTFLARANILSASGFVLWDLVDLCYYDNVLWQADAIFVQKHLKQNFPSLAPMHRKPFNQKLWQQAQG